MGRFLLPSDHGRERDDVVMEFRQESYRYQSGRGSGSNRSNVFGDEEEEGRLRGDRPRREGFGFR